MNNPMTAWLDAVRLALDMQRVIAARMLRLAAGGPLAARETQRMMTEKMLALGEAQVAAAASAITGKRVRDVSAPYRRRIRANRRRLGG